MMGIKRLFQASFEESLNIQDDAFYQFANRTYEQAIASDPNGWNQQNQITMFILSLLFPLGFNYLLAFGSEYFSSNSGNPNFTLTTSSYNFLPYSLHWLLCSIWLGFIIIGRRRFTQKYLFVYRTHFHTQIVYYTWLCIEFNLLFLTMFYPTLTLPGTLLFYGLLIISAYLIIRSRSRSLMKLLYPASNISGKDPIGKLFKFLLTYGGVAVFIWLIIRLVFPSLGEVRENLFGILGMIIMWYLINISYLLLESYLSFPYFLHVYYKLKYPEDYRQWEDKTPEEWYGRQWLEKHGRNAIEDAE